MLIKNGTLITAAETFKADLLIEGEKIKTIAENLNIPGEEVVDASGKLVLPGGIDPHTHFDLEMFGTVSSDDHYTGHKAAAFGGTTTVMDFVVQNPPDESNFARDVEIWRRKAEKAAIDYGFHMNLTHFNEQVAAEIPSLVEMGITTLKVFTAYNGRLRLADGDIFRAMRIAKENGMLVMAHCENGDVIETLVPEALAAGHTTPEWHALTRPAWGAAESILRLAGMAAVADAPLYIVHMNTAGGVDMLRYARERGVPIMGETCPQYLFFTIEHLRRPDGAKWICSPPMRTEADNARLWEGLEQGTIQTVGTDHCPFSTTGRSPSSTRASRLPSPARNWGPGISPKSPTGCPGFRTAFRCCGRRVWSKAGSAPTSLWRSPAPIPPKFSGCTPARGR